MTRKEAKELLLHILMTYEPKDQYGDYDDPEPYEQALTMAIEALSTEPNKAVPPSLADVYKWERDIALSQLEEYGIGFGEKKRDYLVEVVRCKDCRHGWYDDDIEYYVCRHPKGLNEELYGVYFCSYGERREP